MASELRDMGVTKVGRRVGGWAGALAAGLLIAFPPSRLSAQDSLPTGYGTLRRDDVAVRLTTDQVDIQVLPLPEGIIRLLAPDTYRSLGDLVRTHWPAIDSLAAQTGVRHPTLVLVTFVGLVPQARFNPEDVNIANGGRLFRPVAIVPVSPGWGSYQLEAREQATAIYLFDEGISFREDLTVSYQNRSSNAWSRSVRILDQERARVRARVQTASPPP
jgi:hypothetical protein